MSTDTVVLIIVGAALAYELWTVLNHTQGDTISESIWKALYRRPLLAFVLGFLIGHWVWLPQRCWDLMGGKP